jgi:hypothetical protein
MALLFHLCNISFCAKDIQAISKSRKKQFRLRSYRNSQQDATVYQNLLLNVYMKLNMFRASHRPSSGALNCTSSLWFCIRERLLGVEVAGRYSA